MSAKFDWVWALGREGRITDGERYVLTMTALRSANPRTLEFCVRQATVAENFTVSVRLVKSAWSAGRRYGFIEKVSDRKRGSGCHGADTYRLIIPAELGADCAPIRSDVRCTDRQSEVHKTSKLGARSDAVSCDNFGPTWSLNGLKEAADEAAPPGPRTETEEPSDHCPDHRHIQGWVDENCGRCALARKEWAAFKAIYAEAEQQARTARRMAIRTCPLCDDNGLIEFRNGMARCDHQESA